MMNRRDVDDREGLVKPPELELDDVFDELEDEDLSDWDPIDEEAFDEAFPPDWEEDEDFDPFKDQNDCSIWDPRAGR